MLAALPSAAVPALAAPTVPGVPGVVGERHPVQTRDPFGAECRTSIHGSHVTAHCFNPYPATDRVRLHIECDRWWDVDADSAPLMARPARTVKLTGRCWKEVRAVWVSHERS
ncbi:hypothetical protein GUY61_03590 [Streptomyces sp. GC420]|nr:hypothetical protein [Streptomyces sp. GC420]